MIREKGIIPKHDTTFRRYKGKDFRCIYIKKLNFHLVKDIL